MPNELQPSSEGHQSPFECICRTNAAGVEFWSSRDFAHVLGYADYRNFEQVIQKARMACFNSAHPIEDHFVEITEMVEIGKGGAMRPVQTVLLSRYACYLVVQNADPGKEIVALGQTYFAIQTRRQELTDEAAEAERRLLLREEMKLHNVKLAGAAKDAGVVEPVDYAIFQNHGYMGLYGGLDMRAIHRRKGLKKSQQILDHMGSTELAANLFRATQTEEKLRREKIKGKARANQTHREVGAEGASNDQGTRRHDARESARRPKASRNLNPRKRKKLKKSQSNRRRSEHSGTVHVRSRVMDQHEIDLWHMRRALELAAGGQGFVEPNPMVGCVVARGAEIIGEGFHRRFGGPHAEIEALRIAGHRAAGATLYVTLEPCCHQGKTPPCTKAVLAAGVRRVVVAQADPFRGSPRRRHRRTASRRR